MAGLYAMGGFAMGALYAMGGLYAMGELYAHGVQEDLGSRIYDLGPGT